jgi:methylated-DNA-[protein]-cysteine S-methyltransferase
MGNIQCLNFTQRIYLLVKKIPPGKVITYKDIGLFLKTKGYQAIGQVLKKNPQPPFIPCHRVVRNNGILGGYCGKVKGSKVLLKKRLLQKEGIPFNGDKIINFTHYHWQIT